MELREKQKLEAIERIKILKFHPNVKKEFEKEDKLNYSENGILYWVDDDMKKYIEQFEEKTKCLVYHVIKNHFGFGTCYSFLYISSYEEEWQLERDDLKYNQPIVYVENVSDDTCSEFGRIGIEPLFGAVIRTA